MDHVRATYIRDLAFTFRYHKSVADRALAQIADEDLHTLVDGEANSIAIIIKHVAGNLRSRYTDFLTSDGEKPDRNRDGEFEMPERASRTELLATWDRAFGLVLDTIAALQPDDLARTVQVRKEPFTVVEALNRSVTHTAYHIGQIVLLAKHFCGAGWKTLTIPKGKSAEHEIPYKARLQMRPGG
jgi:uncharacterized damage-inducible protein DinB